MLIYLFITPKREIFHEKSIKKYIRVILETVSDWKLVTSLITIMSSSNTKEFLKKTATFQNIQFGL